MTREINQAGIDLIKRFEGCELEAYEDAVNIWTIGYGHTGGVKKGLIITQSIADMLLQGDLREAADIVEDAVDVDLNDNQFAALVSFVFNVGAGRRGYKDGFVTLRNGDPSTMLRLLNDEDYEGAAEEFTKWDMAGGQHLAGLTRRREAEQELFLTEV